MNCPKCTSESNVKDGVVKGKQRYQCKSCGFRYTVEYKGGIHPQYKRLALALYLEGLGIRSIARHIGVSNVAILKWIKAFGVRAETLPKLAEPIKEVEIDELHTYIGSKKTKDGSGLLLIKWSENGYEALLATGRQKQGMSSGNR